MSKRGVKMPECQECKRVQRVTFSKSAKCTRCDPNQKPETDGANHDGEGHDEYGVPE